MTTKAPIKYHGGKCRFTNWIVPIIESYPHKTYIEPFGGAASVLLAKKPGFDVYNDVNGDLVNMFRVVKHKELFETFRRYLELTPYAREVYNDAYERLPHCTNPVERAALFFIKMRQSYSGKQDGQSWGYLLKHKT
jgi:DNA adenine methylase